jgi:hypothetical protein
LSVPHFEQRIGIAPPLEPWHPRDATTRLCYARARKNGFIERGERKTEGSAKSLLQMLDRLSRGQSTVTASSILYPARKEESPYVHSAIRAMYVFLLAGLDCELLIYICGNQVGRRVGVSANPFN